MPSVEEVDAGVRRYCVYCGDMIPDEQLRRWHSANDHPPHHKHAPAFCVYCGEYVPDPQTRNTHYDTCRFYPGRLRHAKTP